MENQATQATQGALTTDLRAGFTAHDSAEQPELQLRPVQTLRIPVGTSLADVERWMIFATLQKSGGNKTRAAALLGVSLKTLYNRLNAYRAQGLAMDYGLAGQVDYGGDVRGGEATDDEARAERPDDDDGGDGHGDDLPGEFT